MTTGSGGAATTASRKTSQYTHTHPIQLQAGIAPDAFPLARSMHNTSTPAVMM
jgi:hypothetical protein